MVKKTKKNRKSTRSKSKIRKRGGSLDPSQDPIEKGVPKPKFFYNFFNYPDFNLKTKLENNKIKLIIDLNDDMKDNMEYSFWIFEDKNPIPINSEMRFVDNKTGFDFENNLYQKEESSKIFIRPRPKSEDEDDQEDELDPDAKIELIKKHTKDHFNNHIFFDGSSEGNQPKCAPLLNKYTDEDKPTIALLGDEVLGTVPPVPTPKPGTLIQENDGKKIQNFNFYSCLDSITTKPMFEKKDLKLIQKEVALPKPSPVPKKFKKTKSVFETSIDLPETIEIPEHKHKIEYDDSLQNWNEHLTCQKYPFLINYYEPECDIQHIDSFDLVPDRIKGIYPSIELENKYTIDKFLSSMPNKPNFKLLLRIVLYKKDSKELPYVRFFEIRKDNKKLKLVNLSYSARPDCEIIKIINDDELLLNPYKRKWDSNEYLNLLSGIDIHEIKDKEKEIKEDEEKRKGK